MNYNTNNTIIMIAGLPGSGKTFLAQRLMQEGNCLLIDDASRNSWRTIKDSIENNRDKNFILCDPYFCEEKERKKAEEKILSLLPGANFTWIFFENDPEQCRINVDLRNDGRKVEGSIKRFSKTYRIPNGVKQIPVWRPSV